MSYLKFTPYSDPGPDSKPDFLRKWERDLNTTFSKAQCGKILLFALKASIATPTQELNYKIFTAP